MDRIGPVGSLRQLGVPGSPAVDLVVMGLQVHILRPHGHRSRITIGALHEIECRLPFGLTADAQAEIGGAAGLTSDGPDTSCTARSLLLGRFSAPEQLEHFTDAPLPADLVLQWQVMLDVVAVAAAISFLHHIPRFGEVNDDAVGGALGHLQGGGKVPQAGVGTTSDEQQRPSVIGEEAPVVHSVDGSRILEVNC
jgi:hypothetical protein